MIRLTFLWLVILGILGYSWKDWYRGVCGMVMLMAVIQHPDMPRSILGIPGLNPWNLLLMNATLCWLLQRRREGLQWDLPRHIAILLLLGLAVVIVGFVRIIGDTSILTLYYREGMTYFTNEYLINTVKWVVPALLLYDGCRSESRFRLAVFSILFVFVVLGIQVAKWVPPQYALDGEALERRTLKVLVNDVGYHRVNLSAMLSGASWAILCTTVLVRREWRWAIVVTALFVVYAQMMTGGRAGYGAWVMVGIVMCLLKWRRYLLIIPVAGLLAALLLPGVVGRALQGFTADTHDTNKRLEQQRAQTISGGGEGEVDSYTVTAGRSLAWPLVIAKIKQRPWTGYGRQAMLRTGVAVYLYETLGEIFPHPHNAYLEMLLDNGIIGACVVLSFYFLMLFYSVRLFLDRSSPTCAAAGGVSAALMLGLMVSSMGSQTFYPREGWDGMWAAMFIVLRVRVERARREKSAETANAATTEPQPRRFAPAAARTAAAAAMPRPAEPARLAGRSFRPPRSAPAPVRSSVRVGVRERAASRGEMLGVRPANVTRGPAATSHTMTSAQGKTLRSGLAATVAPAGTGRVSSVRPRRSTAIPSPRAGFDTLVWERY